MEQAICQIRRPSANLDLCVLDVQRQNGGSDCGFSTTAFAPVLCQEKDPTRSIIDANSSCQLSRGKKLFVVDEWGLGVYCHCKMPDDGSPMVKCKKKNGKIGSINPVKV